MKGKKGFQKGNNLGGRIANRPRLLDYINKDQLREFVEFTLDNYKEDSRLHTWFGDQIFGKAVQPIGNEDGKPLRVEFDSSFNVPLRTNAE